MRNVPKLIGYQKEGVIMKKDGGHVIIYISYQYFRLSKSFSKRVHRTNFRRLHLKCAIAYLLLREYGQHSSYPEKVRYALLHFRCVDAIWLFERSFQITS